MQAKITQGSFSPEGREYSGPAGRTEGGWVGQINPNVPLNSTPDREHRDCYKMDTTPMSDDFQMGDLVYRLTVGDDLQVTKTPGVVCAFCPGQYAVRVRTDGLWGMVWRKSSLVNASAILRREFALNQQLKQEG